MKVDEKRLDTLKKWSYESGFEWLPQIGEYTHEAITWSWLKALAADCHMKGMTFESFSNRIYQGEYLPWITLVSDGPKDVSMVSTIMTSHVKNEELYQSFTDIPVYCVYFWSRPPLQNSGL